MSYYARLVEVEKAPLDERKEARDEFYRDMKHNPDTVGERVGWLLDGNYGYEEMKSAGRVLAMSKRANKVAQLAHMVGVLEWNCPPAMAVAAWKKLSPPEKDALDRAVKAAMNEDSEAKRLLSERA